MFSSFENRAKAIEKNCLIFTQLPEGLLQLSSKKGLHISEAISVLFNDFNYTFTHVRCVKTNTPSHIYTTHTQAHTQA